MDTKDRRLLVGFGALSFLVGCIVVGYRMDPEAFTDTQLAVGGILTAIWLVYAAFVGTAAVAYLEKRRETQS